MVVVVVVGGRPLEEQVAGVVFLFDGYEMFRIVIGVRVVCSVFRIAAVVEERRRSRA